MAARIELLNTLEDLDQSDFGKFEWYLTFGLDSDRRIPKSQLKGAKDTDIVRVMIKHYGDENAVAVAVEILRMMRNNNDADKLESKFRGEATRRLPGAPPAAPGAPPAAPGAPPAAPGAPPAAPITVSAQQNSMQICPMITGGASVGSININYTK